MRNRDPNGTILTRRTDEGSAYGGRGTRASTDEIMDELRAPAHTVGNKSSPPGHQ